MATLHQYQASNCSLGVAKRPLWQNALMLSHDFEKCIGSLPSHFLDSSKNQSGFTFRSAILAMESTYSRRVIRYFDVRMLVKVQYPSCKSQV